MRSARIALVNPRPTPPCFHQLLYKVADRDRILRHRAKVPCLCVGLSLSAGEPGSEQQVATERLKDMLPRANGVGASHWYDPTRY